MAKNRVISQVQFVTQEMSSRLAIAESRLVEIEHGIAAILLHLGDKSLEPNKEWYTTTEVAAIMGVTVYTVAARWCNEGRVEAVQDAQTGKWKIPGREYQRFTQGGGLRPKVV